MIFYQYVNLLLELRKAGLKWGEVTGRGIEPGAEGLFIYHGLQGISCGQSHILWFLWTMKKSTIRALCYELIYPIENTKFLSLSSGNVNSF